MKAQLPLFHPLLGFTISFIACLSLLTPGLAQEDPQELPQLPPVAGAEIGEEIAETAQSHPAVESLTDYLQASISNNHVLAVEFIDPTSIETFKFRTLNAVKTQLDSVVLEGSKRAKMKDILEELGFESMEEMHEMSAKEFYIKVNERRVSSDPSASVTPVESVDVEVLGLAAEDDARTVHFVTRTSHREEVMMVSSLRLTSMIKAGRKWLVSLQARQPRIQPLPDDVIDREKDELADDPELKRLEKLLDETQRAREENPDEQ